tara:strand:+ start:151 stop:363 length:213 start_codon:yes stop_codon:yes gene_type:complete
MIDTDKYEGAKKIVEDAGLIVDNEGHLDIHYRKIADLLAEAKRLEYIVDSIPDDAWQDMKTWEAMKGVIE